MLQKRFQEKVERVKRALSGKPEPKLVGRAVLPKGHKLYEVNEETLEYELVEKQASGNRDTVKNAKYKVGMKPGFRYVSALNEKNLRRKLGLTNRK